MVLGQSPQLPSQWKIFALTQGSQTRGTRGRFVWPAMLFGNFQIINVYVI